MKLYQLIWNLLKMWRGWTKEVNIIELFELLLDFNKDKIAVLEVSKLLLRKGVREGDLAEIDYSLWKHRFLQSIENPTPEQVAKNKAIIATQMPWTTEKTEPVDPSIYVTSQEVADSEFEKAVMNYETAGILHPIRAQEDDRFNSTAFEKYKNLVRSLPPESQPPIYGEPSEAVSVVPEQLEPTPAPAHTGTIPFDEFQDMVALPVVGESECIPDEYRGFVEARKSGAKAVKKRVKAKTSKKKKK